MDLLTTHFRHGLRRAFAGVAQALILAAVFSPLSAPPQARAATGSGKTAAAGRKYAMPLSAHPFFNLPEPAVLAHRGDAAARPENTLPSFDLALQEGADVLETDVHLTQDGETVVMHDNRVDRTTDGTGEIAGLTLAEIKKLDAAQFFSTDGGETFPLRGRGIEVPTLRELFEAYPGKRFNLEIKSADPRAVGAVLDLVQEFGREDMTLLTSGNPAVMRRLRAEAAQKGSKVALGASSLDVLFFIQSMKQGAAPAPEIKALEVPASYAGAPLVTQEFVDHAHKHGIKVYVWTINDPKQMQDLFKMGVDGIFSDDPKTAAAEAANFRQSRRPVPPVVKPGNKKPSL